MMAILISVSCGGVLGWMAHKWWLRHKREKEMKLRPLSWGIVGRKLV